MKLVTALLFSDHFIGACHILLLRNIVEFFSISSGNLSGHYNQHLQECGGELETFLGELKAFLRRGLSPYNGVSLLQPLMPLHRQFHKLKASIPTFSKMGRTWEPLPL